jgi:hypothetical protein
MVPARPLSSPALRTALEHVPVVEQAVEHGADRSRIAQQFCRVAVDDQEVVPGSERLMGGW